MLGGAYLGSGNVFDGVWWGVLKVRRHALERRTKRGRV